MVWLLETYLSLHCKRNNNKQHIVAACCSHIQMELQASFIYMLTTEYISSIYIHACLLLNNTCLQFKSTSRSCSNQHFISDSNRNTGSWNGLPDRLQRILPPDHHPVGANAQDLPDDGFPDMVQKMGRIQRVWCKKNPTKYLMYHHMKLLSGWFEPTSPLFGSSPFIRWYFHLMWASTKPWTWV